jgi:hypothetical protein
VVLDDGTYDAIVVDADEATDGTLRCEVALLGGDHKGDVVAVASSLRRDPLDLLAMPVTLVVHDGEPRLILD